MTCAIIKGGLCSLKALTIAGSDSGGGAGIQADLKTFAALGVYGTERHYGDHRCKHTCGVSAVQGIDPDVVAAQIRAVVSDIRCWGSENWYAVLGRDHSRRGNDGPCRESHRCWSWIRSWWRQW